MVKLRISGSIELDIATLTRVALFLALMLR